MALSNSTLAKRISNLIARWQIFMDDLKGWAGGTATGGPYNDGRYWLTDAYGNRHLVKSPNKLESDILTLEDNAASALSDADSARVQSEDAEKTASEYATLIGSTVTDYDSQNGDTDTGDYSAKKHADDASTSASNAATSESNAATSESNASSHETSADNYQITAQRYANEAEDTTVVNAETSTDTGTYSALHHRNHSEYHKTTSQRYANGAEDTTVVDADTGTDTGTYSSLHHRNKAEAAKTAAEAAESGAQTAETDAGEHETTAHRWANESQNVTVVNADTGSDTGEYSAYHWAQEAKATMSNAMEYMGTWDASTGSYPSSPEKGWFYKVSVQGTVDGVTYKVGDSIIHNGGDPTLSSGWDRIDNTESVSSVNGYTGAVSIGKADVGLGSVENVALSTATWTDMGISKADVSKSDVGLGNVPNTDATNADNISSGTLADARVPQSAVTQHEGAITITESQISDLQSYALSGHTHPAGDIDSGTFADARIAQSNVTQHEGAITITESQISDLQNYALKHLSYNFRTGTSYTLVLSDDGLLVEMNNSSANTVTVPANSTVAFDVGTEISVLQYGAGTTSIAGASGVTIRTPETLNLRKQYSTVTLIKRATDEWVLMGDLEPA